MKTFKVSRRCSASIAHRIYGHEGKCKNFHGHNYHFTLSLYSEMLNPLGMVVDFGDIKEIFDKWISEHWDHKTILYKEDSLARYYQRSTGTSDTIKSQLSDALVYVDWNPTAENMALYLVSLVKDALWRKNLLPSICTIEVSVEETDGNTASYAESVNS